MSDVILKKGDRVKFTVEGEVTYAERVGDGTYFEIDKGGYNSTWGTLEIIQKPLAVGDVVTPENMRLLAENFILADRDGGAWESVSPVELYPEYGPYKLVYIHEAE